MNLALTATRPVIGNYFNRVLEGLEGSLGIKIHKDEDPPCSTQEGLERCLAEELKQLSVSAPSLEGSKSRGLHMGYSLQYADHEKGPSVPALSSTVDPGLLDVIDCLRLGISNPSDKDQSSQEQPDLLESLAAKGVPKSSKTKGVYHKFVNILDAQPSIRDPAPIQRPKGDPPVPPRWADSSPKFVMRNLSTNSGTSVGFSWVPGRIPTDEEDPQRSSIHRGPLHTKPAVFPLRCPFPFHLFLPRGPNLVRGNWRMETPMGQGVFLQLLSGISQWIALREILLQTKCPSRRVLLQGW